MFLIGIFLVDSGHDTIRSTERVSLPLLQVDFSFPESRYCFPPVTDVRISGLDAPYHMTMCLSGESKVRADRKLDTINGRCSRSSMDPPFTRPRVFVRFKTQRQKRSILLFEQVFRTKYKLLERVT